MKTILAVSKSVQSAFLSAPLFFVIAVLPSVAIAAGHGGVRVAPPEQCQILFKFLPYEMDPDVSPALDAYFRKLMAERGIGITEDEAKAEMEVKLVATVGRVYEEPQENEFWADVGLRLTRPGSERSALVEHIMGPFGDESVHAFRPLVLWLVKRHLKSCEQISKY